MMTVFVWKIQFVCILGGSSNNLGLSYTTLAKSYFIHILDLGDSGPKATFKSYILFVWEIARD